MLSIILAVLKIVGTAILIALAIILVLLILLLFVPIRYKLQGKLSERNLEYEDLNPKENLTANLRFSWLFFVVRGGFDYPKEGKFYLKVLFFDIFGDKDTEEKEDDDSIFTFNQKSKKEYDTTVNEQEKTDSESENSKKYNEDIADNAKYKNTDKEDNSERKTIYKTDDDTDAEELDKEAKNSKENKIKKFLKDFFEGKNKKSKNTNEDKGFSIWRPMDFVYDKLDKIYKFFDDFENRIDKIEYTITKLCAKIEMVLDMLESTTFDRAYECAKTQIIKLIRHIWPRKFDAYILYGDKDPANTGNILATVSVLNAMLPSYIDFDADFERNAIAYDVNLKGRIRLITVLICVLKVYFDKNIKKIIHRVQKIMK